MAVITIANSEMIMLQQRGEVISTGTVSIGDESVDSDHYVDGSIDRVHLAADIIDGTKIADDVINSEHYVAASIDNEHLADNAVDTAEIADDAVTAAKLANSINTEITANTAKTGITSGQASAITANTAKVTNATHTGDVTGATALTIATGAVDLAHMSSESVDEDNLYISNTGSNGEFLSKQSGNNGGLTWAAAGSDISVRVTHSVDISINAFTVLPFDTERFDTDTMHDTSTNNSRLTCKTAGLYLIIGQADFLNTPHASYRTLRIRLNGPTDLVQSSNPHPINRDDVRLVVTTLWNLAVDDYVELAAVAGESINIEKVSNASPEFMMVKVG